jgi:SAM-dependent methyltransferase
VKEPTRSFVRLFCPPNPLWSIPRWITFQKERKAYAGLTGGRLGYRDLLPCLNDKSDTTPVGYYFYQDTWAFHKIAAIHPARHVDIGSTALLAGCLAGIVPTVSVDIRPLAVRLAGLTHMQGSIVALPFEDNSQESISSLCVVEHIGLGRYGDPLDPRGSLKAGRELARVLRPGGNLYVSLPIGPESRTLFNAHRIFKYSDALALFPGLVLCDFTLVGNDGILSSLESAGSSDFPVGLFHLTKHGGPGQS